MNDKKMKKNNLKEIRQKRQNNKTGQIHLTETIAVLFIFFILLSLSIVFYYKYSQVAIKQEKEEMIATRAMDSTLKAIFLPELICSRNMAEPEDYCFDLIKIQLANQTFANYQNKYYFNLFSYAKITVEEIYPGNRSWTIYNKPKSGAKKVEPTFFVVALKDELKNMDVPYYSFGYIRIEVYS